MTRIKSPVFRLPDRLKFLGQWVETEVVTPRSPHKPSPNGPRRRKAPGERRARSLAGQVADLQTLSRALQLALDQKERELSAERAARSAMRQAQKLDAVGTLAGGIAHELNSLLTVVLANTSLLQSDLLPQNAEARRALMEVEMAVHRGASMIRKLLAFSRRESVRAVPVRIVSIASEAVDNLRRLIPAGVEIRTEFVDDVPAVMADADAVEQMLFNLATNARDAMPNGGRLTVRVDRTRVSEARAASLQGRPGDYVTLSVTDTGTGMDRATAVRALEPFFTTKAVGQGTGLGLAMVFGLMQQHEGFLEIASVVGRGTTVRLYFPVAPQAIVSEPAPPARVTPQQTILLVEDEPFLRAVAERSLKRLGYSVVSAADGEEGLRLFEENQSRINLVFSDAVMPKLGGVDLLKELRSRGHEVPFILTSGYSERDLRALEGASAPVVQKPWSFADLARVVHRALADKQEGPHQPETTGDA